jgi:hypothetical protein
MRLAGILIYVIFGLSAFLTIMVLYTGFIDYEKKTKFDDACLEAGGIPLRYTWHYDKKQHKIEYTCLSVNAVIDIE